MNQDESLKKRGFVTFTLLEYHFGLSQNMRHSQQSATICIIEALSMPFSPLPILRKSLFLSPPIIRQPKQPTITFKRLLYNNQMGAEQCCHEPLQKSQLKDDQKSGGIHYPANYYAVKIQNPNELPFNLNELRDMHPVPDLPRPEWYPEKQTFYIDQTFLILSFGVYYRGEWIRGIPYGKAEIFNKQGEYFKGYLKEGVVQYQQCYLVSSPAKYYVGGVSKNKKHGKGKFIDGNYSFQGKWANNLPHGPGGIQTLPNGDRFQGLFLHGQKSEGTYTWAQGPYQTYTGSFLSNELHGKGQLKLRNGTTWSGYFDCSKNNLEIKDGNCVFEDQIFEGDVADLKPDQGCVVQVYRNQMLGKTRMFRGKIFEGRLLVHYENSIKSSLRDILAKIEAGYQNSQKHSEALAIIQTTLPDYTIQFWSPDQPEQGLAIVPICGRYLRLNRRE